MPSSHQVKSAVVTVVPRSKLALSHSIGIGGVTIRIDIDTDRYQCQYVRTYARMHRVSVYTVVTGRQQRNNIHIPRWGIRHTAYGIQHTAYSILV